MNYQDRNEDVAMEARGFLITDFSDPRLRSLPARIYDNPEMQDLRERAKKFKKENDKLSWYNLTVGASLVAYGAYQALSSLMS